MNPREKAVTPADVVALLNEAAVLDPAALQALCLTRVPCNRELAEHPAIQVGPSTEIGPGNPYMACVGLLGIINGLFGIDPDGWGCIQAQFGPGVPIRFSIRAPRQDAAAGGGA